MITNTLHGKDLTLTSEEETRKMPTINNILPTARWSFVRICNVKLGALTDFSSESQNYAKSHH